MNNNIYKYLKNTQYKCPLLSTMQDTLCAVLRTIFTRYRTENMTPSSPNMTTTGYGAKGNLWDPSVEPKTKKEFIK